MFLIKNPQNSDQHLFQRNLGYSGTRSSRSCVPPGLQLYWQSVCSGCFGTQICGRFAASQGVLGFEPIVVHRGRNGSIVSVLACSRVTDAPSQAHHTGSVRVLEHLAFSSRSQGSRKGPVLQIAAVCALIQVPD
jgi:hypothetical protein